MSFAIQAGQSRLLVKFNDLPFMRRAGAKTSLMKCSSTLPISAAFCLVLSACTGMPQVSQAETCSNGLDHAFAELEDAKAKGFSGTISWVKAASLLSAAKVQQQFEKYPNCIEKVHRARQYIHMAKRGV